MKTKFLGLILIVVTYTGCTKQNQKGVQEEVPSEQFEQKQWFKGNLHTHSYWSDGDEFPEVIMDWYKSNGYQFVALSDHNTLAEGRKWVTISDDSIYQKAFNNYLDKYGSDWVRYRTRSGQTQVKLKTLEEYRDKFEEERTFLIIQSEEITDRFENKPLHMNATNIQKKIEPQGGESVVEVLQNNIDEVIKQRNKTGVPMIPHINHPNFGYGISLEDMIELRGDNFFEVYNGHPQVHNLGDSIHISTEEMWDKINIAYLNEQKPIMYGLATDDSHHYHVQGAEWSNAGRGWIMVLARSLRPSSLIQAMEMGHFYASTGVLLDTIAVKDNKLYVDVRQDEGVTYSISFIGCKKNQSEPEVFLTVMGAEAEYELSEDQLFVRCKIISSKLQSNPIENMMYEMAWTQPVIFEPNHP
jgi:hypothetical protein